MKSLELPCNANPRDRLTLARVGGCVGVTVNEDRRSAQVNLTPADARRAAAWLLEFAIVRGEVEASRAALAELVEVSQEHGLGYGEVTP